MKRRMIKLGELTLHSNNPRRKQENIEELAESIRSNGLIQALAVIDGENGKEVIIGSRRFKALNMVYDAEQEVACDDYGKLSDDEILSLQIVENLQRENIHPLEEVAAIKKKIKEGGIEEAAAVLGKDGKYIKRMLLLDKLIPPFKRIFKKDGMYLHQALLICRYPKLNQEALFEQVEEDDIKEMTAKDILWYLNNNTIEIDSISFPLDATDLGGEGACVNCKYNTEDAEQLFEGGKKVCTNLLCYNKKVNNYIKKIVKEFEATNQEYVFLGNDWLGEEYEGQKVKNAGDYSIMPNGRIKGIFVHSGYSWNIGDIVNIEPAEFKMPKVQYSSPIEEKKAKLERKKSRIEKKLYTEYKNALRNTILTDSKNSYTNAPDILKETILRIVLKDLSKKDIEILYPDLMDIEPYNHPEALKQFIKTDKELIEFLLTIASLRVFYTESLSAGFSNNLIDLAAFYEVEIEKYYAEALLSSKAEIEEEEKELKEEEKEYKKWLKEKKKELNSKTPIELPGGTVYTYGDDLSKYDERDLKRIARYFKISIPKKYMPEDIQEEISSSLESLL